MTQARVEFMAWGLGRVEYPPTAAALRQFARDKQWRCGQPVNRQRSEFCSKECQQRVHRFKVQAALGAVRQRKCETCHMRFEQRRDGRPKLTCSPGCAAVRRLHRKWAAAGLFKERHPF